MQNNNLNYKSHLKFGLKGEILLPPTLKFNPYFKPWKWHLRVIHAKKIHTALTKFLIMLITITLLFFSFYIVTEWYSIKIYNNHKCSMYTGYIYVYVYILYSFQQSVGNKNFIENILSPTAQQQKRCEWYHPSRRQALHQKLPLLILYNRKTNKISLLTFMINGNC